MAARNDENSIVCAKSERAAAFIDSFIARKRLSLGELAFRINAEQRDLQRLVRDRTCGPRLECSLHSYFGRVFGEAVYGPIWGDGPSRRERELENERAEIAARRERIERERAQLRRFRMDAPGLAGLADEQDGWGAI